MGAPLPVTRRRLGLEAAKSLSATFGDLQLASSAGYLHVLGETLQRFEGHFHLFAGSGDAKGIRAFLHAEGVLSRVRFLGPIPDILPVMEAIDLYLAAFPQGDEESLRFAMEAAKPVVVMGYPLDSPFGKAAQLLDIPDLIASSESRYAEIAQRLIRDETARVRISAEVQARFLDLPDSEV